MAHPDSIKLILLFRYDFCTLTINIYTFFFFFSSRRRHTRWPRDWSSDVCSSDLVETGGNIEESEKANKALSAVFPAMIVLMLTVIIFQVRSFSGMSMVVLTAPLGLAGVVPTLLLFHQPFGFNAILGLIALAGILMRNTLILIGQIKTNQEEGLDIYHAVVEATVQRSRPVILTALAAVLAFIPLTFSVFWGSMAFTLIGGTAVGTVLTLMFLPALYSIWFGAKPTAVPSDEAQAVLAHA